MNNSLLRYNNVLPGDVSARQLRAFATLALTLSYTEAANRLHFTEQGVNAQIKRLERLLGCKLLERSGRGLRLTGEGSALLPACLDAIEAIERLGNIHRSVADARRITIVASHVTGAYLLPPVIRAFTAERPRILVDLLAVPRNEVMPLIAAGVATIALANVVARMPLPAGFSLTYWLDEPLALLRSAVSPPPPKSRAVIYHTFERMESGGILHKQLGEAGIQDYELRRVPSSEAVKGACEAGLGYAYLPCHAAQLEIQAGLLDEVAGFRSAGTVWICHPPMEELSTEARDFLRFLIEQGPALVPSENAPSSAKLAKASDKLDLSEKRETLPIGDTKQIGPIQCRLSDEEWDQVVSLLPSHGSRRGRPRRSERALLEGMLWICRTGASWRELPKQYGPWQTAYDRYAEWQRAGIWELILRTLEECQTSAASTFIRPRSYPG